MLHKIKHFYLQILSFLYHVAHQRATTFGAIKLSVTHIFHNLIKGKKLEGQNVDNVLFSKGYIWHCQLLDRVALNGG